MNSLQITYFLALAKHLNFTKTANYLYVAQPAVSKQISALERELGVKLFERTKKQVQLSHAGRLYYIYFSKAAEEFENVKKRADQLSMDGAAGVRIGFLETWDIPFVINGIIGYFNREYPGVSVSFECYDFVDLVRNLKKCHIDVALCISGTFAQVSDVQTRSICNVPVSLFFSRSHAVAQKPNPEIRDFSSEPFLIVEGNDSVYVKEVICQFCRPYGFEPRFRTVPNTSTMLLLIDRGIGVGFLDQLTHSKRNRRLLELPTSFTHSVTAAWLDENLNDYIPVVLDNLEKLLPQSGEYTD